MHFKKFGFYLLLVFVVIAQVAFAQFRPLTQWTSDGNAIFQNKEGNIIKVILKPKLKRLWPGSSN